MQRPAIGSGRSWAQFLVGFALLGPVLLGISALGSTGRWVLVILAVGLGAMLVAAVTAIPLAYLHETGHRSIWPPALVHTTIDAFKPVKIPAAALSTFSLLIILVSLTVSLLALAAPRRVLLPARPHPPTVEALS